MILLLLLAFVASVLLTGLFRRYAIASQLIDIPNDRSSHQFPTPRGGGLAIVCVFLLSVPFFFWLDLFSLNDLYAFLLAGILVAFVGYMDDRQHIPAYIRLFAHFLAAGWIVFWVGGIPLPFIADTPILKTFNILLSLVYLVWLLNLYNFMDGIDGLASIEAISICLGVGLLYWFADAQNGQYWPLFLLAMATAGFLYWNFPPAKIFMGDGGSGFLGIVFGIFSLKSASIDPLFFWSWLILLGVFVVDASWTLLCRIWQGEKIYQAHCRHAYQKAARYYHGHKPVSMTVAAINLFWLLPIALCVGLGQLNGFVGIVLAYSPLLLCALIFKAGTKEELE